MIGVLIAGVGTVVAGAVSISTSEAKRVVADKSATHIVDKVNSNQNDLVIANGTSHLAKALDKQSYIAAKTVRVHNLFYESQSAITKAAHLFSSSKVWDLKDPTSSRTWYSNTSEG